MHLATTLAAQKQPDILNLHLEFLLPCVRQEMTITVNDLKIGMGASTIQLQVKQKDKLKVTAIATSTNFAQPVGPSAKTEWAFHPPPRALPDFEKVLAHKPDSNWLPATLSGDILPFSRRQLSLNPRGGFATSGILDAWNTFPEEPMDATYLTMMTDCIPSMSDTLLRNGGPYDAHTFYAQMEAWAEKNPGVPAPLTNSMKDAMKATIFNMTLTLDIEFKKGLPKEGLDWAFTRAATRMMQNGRLDLDVTICDRNMDILCLSRQVILVLEANRKFVTGKSRSRKLLYENLVPLGWAK